MQSRVELWNETHSLLLSLSSSSASAASSICRCRGLQATCSCCRIRCRESSSPFRRCCPAICSAVSGGPLCSRFDTACSCCCSTDLLSHPRAIFESPEQRNYFLQHL